MCYWQCCFNIKEFICLDSILQQSSSEISPTQETDMIHFTGTSFTIVILKALQKINCRHDLLTYIMRRSHWLNTDALRYLTTSRHTDTSFLNTTSQDGNLPVNVLSNCLHRLIWLNIMKALRLKYWLVNCRSWVWMRLGLL